MNPKLQELKDRWRELSDLQSALAVLSWDQQTMMPQKGTYVRAEQLATLGRVVHEKFTSPEIAQ